MYVVCGDYPKLVSSVVVDVPVNTSLTAAVMGLLKHHIMKVTQSPR
jgi:hypothetical protein